MQAAAAIGRARYPRVRHRLLRGRLDGRRRRARQHRDDGHGRPHLLAARGNKLADNNADFYDGELGRRGQPDGRVRRRYWRSRSTACGPAAQSDGTKGVHTDPRLDRAGRRRSIPFAAFGQAQLRRRIGPLSGNGWLAGDRAPPSTRSPRSSRSSHRRRLSSVEISSDPGSDGNYATGDEIAVAFTFGKEVDVSGNPSDHDSAGRRTPRPSARRTSTARCWSRTRRRPRSAAARSTPPRRSSPSASRPAPSPAATNSARSGSASTRSRTPRAPDGQLTVTVNRDNNGAPGSVRCTLTNPASLRSNVLSSFDCDRLPAARWRSRPTTTW